MSIVYILTNESMPEVIKIGVTDNLEQRIKQLDNTSVPLPFECYYAVEVSDAASIEKKMHQGLSENRIRQNREFFNVAPENAKSLLEIAEVMGGKNVTPPFDIVENVQDQQALNHARNRRRNFNFSMLGIGAGTTLKFVRDKSITCEVFDDRSVTFREEVTSLSQSAITLLNEMGNNYSTVNGTLFWCSDNRTLNELRSESGQ